VLTGKVDSTKKTSCPVMRLVGSYVNPAQTIILKCD